MMYTSVMEGVPVEASGAQESTQLTLINVQSAAKHMGYLPGTFTEIPGPALPGFIGTSRNGITTLNYGVYESTYYLHKGIFNPAANTQAIDVQAKNLQTQVEALGKMEQNLSAMIKSYEGSLKDVLKKI